MAFSQLDSTFGTAGMVTITGSSLNGIKILDDGKILVLMRKNNVASLVRFMSDGSVDNTFVSQNLDIAGVTSSTPLSMAVQSDGKIVAMIDTNMGSTSNTLVRFNTDGTIDSLFGNNGYVFSAFLQGNNVAYNVQVAIDPVSGNILITGNIFISSPNTNMPIIACYNSSGVLNTAFYGSGIRGWAPSEHKFITNLAVDTSGKIIVVGTRGYSSYVADGSATDTWMMRLNSDASTDTTFSGDGIFSTDVGSFYYYNFDKANSLYLRENGSVLVIGQTGSYISNSKFMVFEVTTDGNLTNTAMPLAYNCPGSTYIGKPYEVVRDNDGKFILGGSVAADSVSSNFGILMLNPDYSIHTAFGTNGWVSYQNQSYNYGLRAIAVQPADNKIVVLGSQSGTQVVIARYLNTTTTALNTEEHSTTNRIMIFPNPANNDLNVLINDNSVLDSTYNIVDVNGRVLVQGVLTNVTSQINIENLSKGIYFLKFGKQNLTQKFIKQ